MLLLSTYSLKGYGIHKIFEIVQKSGYDGIDLYMDLEEYDLWDSEYIKSLSNLFGVKVLSITGPQKGLTKTKFDKMLEIGKILNIEVLTLTPPHIKDKGKTWFSKIGEIKNKYNFKIAIQNIETKYIFFIIPEYRSNNLEQLKEISGYTSLDIGNVEESGSVDIIKAVKILGNSMKNIYLSDKFGEKKGLLPGKTGISNLPLESFLMHLKAQIYNGFVTLKVEPNELGCGELELVFKNLEDLKDYYKKYYLDFK